MTMATNGETPVAPARENLVEVENLKVHFPILTGLFQRETGRVRAVDDISLAIARNEIYGLAGESSCGKSTLIRTIAGAIRPPLNVVSGAVRFDFGGRRLSIYEAAPRELAAIRWKHLSYIMQGSMSVLNPVRGIKHSFGDFAFRHIRQPMPVTKT